MNESKESHNNNNYIESYSGLLDFCQQSYTDEKEREKSLIRQSSQMITAFSFVSAVILMIIPLVKDSFNGIFIASFSIIILFLLFASMILALLVQRRFKYTILSSPKQILEHVEKSPEDYDNEKDMNRNFILSLEEMYQGKKKINDKRVKYIIASECCFIAAIITLGIATFTGVLLMTI